MTACLAVPAALPVSLLLAPAAQAQTSLGNSSSTVNLNGAGSNPFSIAAGVTIDVASTNAIYGDSSRAWTLSNAGTVRSGAAEGVDLKSANGTLTNLGGALIYGNSNGAELGTGAAVANSGTIESSVSDGGSYGILLDGTGSVSNNTGATIAGYNAGIQALGAASIGNAGTIFSTLGEGVYLNAGGTVTNAAGGLISGYSRGVVIRYATGDVQNAGSIVARSTAPETSPIGVDLTQGGTLGNAVGGHIYGDQNGVAISGAGTVDNAGSIGAGYEAGVSIGSGDVLNQAGATISGNAGVSVSGIGSLTNSGAITGTAVGVSLGAGSVTNAVSGHITGNAAGLTVAGADAVLVNAGSIIGTGQDGVVLHLGGSATNAAGGYIHGGGIGLAAGYSGNTAGNAANIQNSGIISGSNTGVLLYGLEGGQVTNFAGGSITSDGVGLGEFGTDASISNSGLIEGNGFTGIFVNGGDITNASGATISGHYGIIINGTGSLTNSGHIIGVSGGAYVGTGNVNNTAGATISGGQLGVYLYQAGSELTNAGLVMASAGDAVKSKFGATVINQAGGSLAGAISYAGIRVGYSNNTASNIGIVQNSGSIDGGSGILLYGLGGGTLTNMAGGRITGGGFGVQIASGTDSVGNAGYIHAQSYYGVAINAGRVSNASTGTISGGGGVDINVAGTLINSGLIAGGNGARIGSGGVINSSVINNATGTITAEQIGVFLNAAGDSLSNAGIINGGAASGDIGAYLKLGGSVLNQPGGHITGNVAVQNGYRNDSFAGAGVIENQGVIAGGSFGVALLDIDGGRITNAAGATISGGEDGIYTAMVVGRISNSGTITGGIDGVDMAGGVLTNAAGALIDGGGVGLAVYGAAQINNAGTIRDKAGAGAILSGAATLTNTGTIAGITGLILSGDSAAVINSGVIASTQAGGNAILVTAPDPAEITLTSASVLTGAIDGGGTDGQIVLQGSNQMGNDIVNFGTGSALAIVSGANWVAAANWTIANVTNSGTFQPGLLGTPLRLTGNYAQLPGATMQVIVTPTLSSQFIITGNAALAGTLNYVFAPGTYAAHVYDFLTATGTVTGHYTAITYGGAAPTIFTRSTNIMPGNADLVLAGSGTQYTGPPVPAPATSSPPSAPQTVPQITAVVAPADASLFSAAPQVLAELTQQDTGLLLGKAALGADAGSTACAAAAAVSPLATSPDGTPKAGEFASIAARAVCGAGGWVSATGGVLNADATGGAPSYAADTAGFMAGIDRQVSDAGARLGLAVGYDQVNLHDDLLGKFAAGVTRVGLYGSQPLGRFMLAAELSGGFSNNSTTRQTGIGALRNTNATDIVSGGLQASTYFSLGPVLWTPAAGIRFATVSAGSISETAPGALDAFAVSGDTPDYSSVQPYLSMQVSRQFSTGNGVVVTPAAGFGYEAELSDHGQATDVLAADGTRFVTAHNNLNGNAALLGLGISAGKAAWTVYASDSAELAGNWSEQTGEIGIQAKF